MSEDESRRCAGVNAAGVQCGAHPSFIDADGWCPAHRPGGRERLREAGRKGAQATARRLQSEGLDDSDLPPLRTPGDAETWLESIGRAVATGRLSNRDGDAATRAVRAWLAAHEAGHVAERMEKLRQQVDELKRKGLRAV